jgi:protein-disulfide isomerase
MTASPVRRGFIAGVVVLAFCATAPSFAMAQSQETTETGQPATEQSAQQSAPAAEPAEGAGESAAPSGAAEPAAGKYALGDIALGDPNAPLTVYEYASFTCPHCASFHADTFPEFKKQYIDTGKVRFILREVYFDQYGLWASMVARCGGENGFYPMVEAFLTTQSTWTRAPDIGHAIQQVGRRAGLPADRLEQCLSDRDFAKSLLEGYQKNRDADDVKSTPTFIINGEAHAGTMSFEDFSMLIDKSL